MAHPLSGPYDFKGSDSNVIEERANRALATLDRYHDALAAQAKLPKNQRTSVAEATLEPIAAEDLQAIPVFAAYVFQSFDHFQIDDLQARYILKSGAEIERLTQSEDKLCTIMHAMFQVDNVAMTDEGKIGRNTLSNNKDWIIKQAKSGHPQCMRILAFMHCHSGTGVKRDPSEAIRLLGECIKASKDPFAHFDLGRIYAGRMGKDLSDAQRKAIANDAKAAIHFQKAAELGHVEAKDTLGYLIAVSFTSEKNSAGFALKLAQEEIEQRGGTTNILQIQKPTPASPLLEPLAPSKLHRLQDVKYGMTLIEDAAKLGRLSAIYSMAQAYRGEAPFSKQVQPDLDKAVEWLKNAAEKGYPRAMIALAKIYETWSDKAKKPHDEHNQATAMMLYENLLGRTSQFHKRTVGTQPLTKEQREEVIKSRAALEARAVEWKREADGTVRLTFPDNKQVELPLPPYVSISEEIKRGDNYANGKDGFTINPVQAIAIYNALLARKNDDGETMLAPQEVKTIEARIEDLVRQSQKQGVQLVVDAANGNRLLVFRNVDGKPFVNVHLAPDEKWIKQQAAKAAGTTAPERPTDDRKPSGDKNDKEGGPNG